MKVLDIKKGVFPNLSFIYLFNPCDDAFWSHRHFSPYCNDHLRYDSGTRYTVEGLRSVPSALHDAGSMSGVTRIQRLLKIEFPLAFPHIMLGLNQSVVFALFMVIIGAFIGTEDLGQYIMKALSDLKGGGKGLILGLCVAFIGLAVDNLIRTWAERRKQLLGLS